MGTQILWSEKQCYRRLLVREKDQSLTLARKRPCQSRRFASTNRLQAFFGILRHSNSWRARRM